MFRAAVAAVIGALILAAGGAAITSGKAQPAYWWLSYGQLNTQVEQQAGVVNPTICVWDFDDKTEFTLYGQLEPGESRSVTGCQIADWSEHLSSIVTSTAGLKVTATIGSISVSGSSNACIIGPDYDAGHVPPWLPIVPDSNGGVGIRTEVTFTVTNTSGRRIRQARATATIGPLFYGVPCVLGARFGFDPAWQVGSG